MGQPDGDRVLLAVTAATIAVYVLVMAGATAAIVEAVSQCGTWPACGTVGTVTESPDLLIALSHRVLAGIAGLLVIWAAVSAWKTDNWHARLGAVFVVALYPVQIGIGALIALNGASSTLTGFHLAVGLLIFSGLIGMLIAVTREAYLDQIDPNPSPPQLPADVPDGRPPVAPNVTGLRGTIVAYVRLTKPRLMWLLCLVAAAGMALAAGPALTVSTAIATLIGGVLAIGASGTFNHVLERDLDRRMQRTADRPLPTDQIGVRRATAFGLILAISAIGVFATLNLLAAALGLAAIAYYSVVYTLLLKPNTVQNTVVGGLAGSFPALIGAAAATNTIGVPALLLALVIFLWTPAHFYNLALVYRDDYERGGVPMFPVIHGEIATRTHILAYLTVTMTVVAILAVVAGLGPIYSVTAVTFGAVFLLAVVDLHRRPAERTAWRSFHASNAFLGAILLAIIVDTLIV